MFRDFTEATATVIYVVNIKDIRVLYTVKPLI